ncbi:MAG: hypothetical protein AAGA96_15890 [Verrucomicrobiota bacterium]
MFNKIVGALALGLPVLAGDSPGTREILSAEEVIYSEREAEGIVAKLMQLLESLDVLQGYSLRGAYAFDRLFDRRQFQKSFRELIVVLGTGGTIVSEWEH